VIDVGHRPGQIEWEARWDDKSPAGKCLIAVRQGSTRRDSALFGGVSKSLLHEWIQRGELHEHDDPVPEEEQAFVEFVDALTRAEANSNVELVALWRSHAKDDWRAAKELLARRNPAEWGQRVELETHHSGEVTTGAFDPVLTAKILASPEALAHAMAIDEILLGEDGGFDEDDASDTGAA
jgi:hypothetical protein